MSTLEFLKKTRMEINPNMIPGEYTLAIILKAMHDYAEYRIKCRKEE